MQLWQIVIIVSFLLVLIAWALQRVAPTRSPGLEGLEDPELTAAFDRISAWPQFRLLRFVILRQIEKLHPTGTLVDVGCGPGYLITSVVKQFPDLDVIGIDLSEEITARAKNRVELSGIRNRVVLRTGDVEKLPINDDSVDVIISTLSLHHWQHPSVAFIEFFRVLKPGGKLLVFDLRRDSPRLMYGIVRFAQSTVLPKALGRYDEPTGSFRASYTPAEIADIMRTTPFPTFEILAGPIWTITVAEKPLPLSAGVYTLADAVGVIAQNPDSVTP